MARPGQPRAPSDSSRISRKLLPGLLENMFPKSGKLGCPSVTRSLMSGVACHPAWQSQHKGPAILSPSPTDTYPQGLEPLTKYSLEWKEEG